MESYFDGNLLLGKVIRSSNYGSNPLNFHSMESDLLQVAIWQHPARKVLDSHFHNPIVRTTEGTSEVLVVLSGRVHADLYDKSNLLRFEIELSRGDILISINGGHGFTVIEEDTVVIEVKNGPYFGKNIDKTLFSSGCTLN